MQLLGTRVSDEALSRRLASGEAAAFDELYRRYVHRLAAYAGGLLGDRTAGEDVSQVALLNAYQALRRGAPPGKVRPWLYRIAHNEAVDLLARRRELLRGFDREDTPAPPDGAAERGALVEALGRLPERQRRAYLMREVQGLRVAEIAAELALSAQQVEQALFAARNRLAEVLVFGDGVTCDAAQVLADGPLTLFERRALRRHFRTCESCRASEAGAAFGRAGLFSFPLGKLADLLVGAGAPAAAKVGAVVAAASVAGGAAVAPNLIDHHRRPAVGPEPAQAAVLPLDVPRSATALQVAAHRTQATEAVVEHPFSEERSSAPETEHRSGSGRTEDVPERGGTTEPATREREGGGDTATTEVQRTDSPRTGGGGGGDTSTETQPSAEGGGVTVTVSTDVPETETTTTTTTTTETTSGSGSGGSHDAADDPAVDGG